MTLSERLSVAELMISRYELWLARDTLGRLFFNKPIMLDRDCFEPMVDYRHVIESKAGQLAGRTYNASEDV